MILKVQQVNTYNKLRTLRDFSKMFYRFMKDIMELKGQGTLVVSRDYEDHITLLWGTTPESGLVVESTKTNKRVEI